MYPAVLMEEAIQIARHFLKRSGKIDELQELPPDTCATRKTKQCGKHRGDSMSMVTGDPASVAGLLDSMQCGHQLLPLFLPA